MCLLESGNTVTALKSVDDGLILFAKLKDSKAFFTIFSVFIIYIKSLMAKSYKMDISDILLNVNTYKKK